MPFNPPFAVLHRHPRSGLAGSTTQNTSTAVEPNILTFAQTLSAPARFNARISNTSKPTQSMARTPRISLSLGDVVEPQAAWQAHPRQQPSSTRADDELAASPSRFSTHIEDVDVRRQRHRRTANMVVRLLPRNQKSVTPRIR